MIHYQFSELLYYRCPIIYSMKLKGEKSKWGCCICVKVQQKQSFSWKPIECNKETKWRWLGEVAAQFRYGCPSCRPHPHNFCTVLPSHSGTIRKSCHLNSPPIPPTQNEHLEYTQNNWATPVHKALIPDILRAMILHPNSCYEQSTFKIVHLEKQQQHTYTPTTWFWFFLTVRFCHALY